MWQNLVVGIVVAACLFYAGRRIWRTLAARNRGAGGCGCGCEPGTCAGPRPQGLDELATGSATAPPNPPAPPDPSDY
ncbi:MAG: FeoB-associated Cys-rich membrane protein [Deltaproteobacteria bacterium]|nr:FeoB-associated Cys-rich membrane protein [Deltaproteobacteria bacterium]